MTAVWTRVKPSCFAVFYSGADPDRQYCERRSRTQPSMPGRQTKLRSRANPTCAWSGDASKSWIYGEGSILVPENVVENKLMIRCERRSSIVIRRLSAFLAVH